MRFEHLPDLEIQKNDIIHFQDGMLGFEEYKDFVVLEDDENPFIMILQSTDDLHPSFVVVDPFEVLDKYEPILSKQDLDYFGQQAEIKYLLVTVITDDVAESVVNLKSPIAIDVKTNRAKQVFLENDYSIRQRLFASN